MGDAGTNASVAVAVLINHPTQWPEALRTCRAFRATGSTVTLFCLGQAPMTIEAPLDDLWMECYADTCQIGMGCLHLQEIAERLKQNDLVIPI